MVNNQIALLVVFICTYILIILDLKSESDTYKSEFVLFSDESVKLTQAVIRSLLTFPL